jgi:hypothetical protein
MTFCGKHFWLGLAAAIFFIALADRAQQIPAGHATNFTSNTYYEPPHEKQVKMQLSGSEASPLPGGLLDVKQLRIEVFDLDGKLQATLRAPQCTYALMDGYASSAGHLEMQTSDGKIRTEGDGFLWRQSDNSLTISNHVYTVIKTGIWKLTVP